MGVPQILIILLCAVFVGTNAVNHKKPRYGHYDVFRSLFFSICAFALLFTGGFFS